jgi:hypothetical protein
MRTSQGIRDAVNRVINVMILVIMYNTAAVLNTRTASTVHNTEVILPLVACTLKVWRPM